MQYQEIIARDNNKLKRLVKLINNRSYRYEEGLAVIYGLHLIEEALKNGILDTIFVAKDNLQKYTGLLNRCNHKHIYVLDKSYLTKLNLADSEIDVVATIILKQGILNDEVYNQDCVILENIQDAGNLGTIMRSVAAAGIKNVILSKNSVDPYNVKVLRSSQGIQFKLNIINNVDIQKFISNYKGQVLTTSINSKKSIYTCDLKNQIAWVFGNEGNGLSKETLNLKQCDEVTIPMLGDSESLNIAMAVTICVFEGMRQKLDKFHL